MIGIDIVSIPRMARFMDRYGERGLLRFLSDSELSFIKNPKNAAGFWAAKEAISKALKCGICKELTFHDIFLSKSSSGAPIATLSQMATQHFGIKACEISITHDGEYAIAVAFVVRDV